MKILIISNYYPPHYIGGYELACLNTVNFLKSCGHEVFVLTGNFIQESFHFESIYRKLKYINYDKPSFWNKHKVETHNYHLTKKVIQNIQPDLVYLWSLRLVSLSPAIAVQDLKVKRIFEIGDFWMKGYCSNSILSKIKRSIKSILPFTICKEVDYSPAICVSKWVEAKMKETYHSKQTYVIPNGTTIYEKKKKDLKKTINYMFCGRLDYSKGLDLALRAFSSLKDQGIYNFSLNVYGEGDNKYLKTCKNMVNVLNLNKEVHFLGKKTSLKTAYDSNDILLMPTRMEEPFGLVIIEAMAAGVVVIASTGYGPSEIISHKKNGLLFIREDVEDLSYNILKIHNNSYFYKKLRNNAFNLVFSKFNLLSVKKDVETVLLDTLKKNVS